MKTLYLKLLLVNYSLIFSGLANACTGFGAITEEGTLLAKNRDYYYIEQQFALQMPLEKLNHWYDNTYHHRNQFYAVTSAKNISMGVNQHGLAAIEEDSIHIKHPHDVKEYERLQQQQGVAYGMVLYGVLQNFNTIDEMIPYLSKIFSVAAPDFYQFSDGKKLLTVEVARKKNNTALKHAYTYQIFSKKNDYFVHTNMYLSPSFSSANNSISNPQSFDSAKNRLARINYLISHTAVFNTNTVSRWLRDTYSKTTNTNSCLNNSLFRSNLQTFKSIDMNTPNNKIGGTIATMIINHQKDFKSSTIYLMMLSSITTEKDGRQLIKLNQLDLTLDKLFSGDKPKFTHHEFFRNPPINNICN